MHFSIYKAAYRSQKQTEKISESFFYIVVLYSLQQHSASDDTKSAQTKKQG